MDETEQLLLPFVGNSDAPRKAGKKSRANRTARSGRTSAAPAERDDVARETVSDETQVPAVSASLPTASPLLAQPASAAAAITHDAPSPPQLTVDHRRDNDSYCESTFLLDLSRQQRNLILMTPLFELESSKAYFRGVNDETNLFRHLDCHYLSLSMLDVLMEGVAFGEGQPANKVVEHLAEIVYVMDPTISRENCLKIGDYVFGKLCNRDQRLKKFTVNLFDGKTKSMTWHDFGLVTLHEQFDEILYRPTQEGFLVYLGMLELSPEDSAELTGIMLNKMIGRGKFIEATDFGRIARALSIEFRQTIREMLERAKRSAGAVSFKKTLGPKIEQARSHVDSRRKQDYLTMTAVQRGLSNAEDDVVKDQIKVLLQLLQDAVNIRLTLQNELMAAPKSFLDINVNAFRRQRVSHLPNPEETILPELLKGSAQMLAAQAELLTASTHPPKIPRIFDLNSVLALLLEKAAKPLRPQVIEDGQLIEEELSFEKFSEEEVTHGIQWLMEQFASVESIAASQLLKSAEKSQSRNVVLIIALFLYLTADEYADFSAYFEVRVDQEYFMTEHICGQNLTFVRRRGVG